MPSDTTLELVLQVMKDQHEEIKQEVREVNAEVKVINSRVMDLEADTLTMKNRWATIKSGIRWIGGVLIAIIGGMSWSNHSDT